jgi:RNA polymerase sigma factor, sigma-70 family
MRRELAYYDLERGVATLVDGQDAAFVRRLQANEDAAYDELVRIYNSSIYHVAYRMLGDSAEASDAVQDIFLKVFRNIGTFRGDASLKTWIFRIGISEILNRLRWWKRRVGYRRFPWMTITTGMGVGSASRILHPRRTSRLSPKRRNSRYSRRWADSPKIIDPSLTSGYRGFFLHRDRGCSRGVCGNCEVASGRAQSGYEEVPYRYLTIQRV